MQSEKSTPSPIAFHRVTRADKSLFERYVVASDIRNCDMSFANIYCWQDTYRSEVAEWGGWLFIRFCYDGEHRAFMQPVGEGSRRAVVDALTADAAARGENLVMVGLDAEWCEFLAKNYPEQWASYAPRSLSDYIYLTSDLATLPGRKYQPKRNHINHFTSQYSWRVEPISGANLADCKVVYDRWLAAHCSECRGEVVEALAVERAFSSFDQLPLSGRILYADERPVAFAYGSAVNHDTFCIHVEKADASVDGASAMINRLMAEAVADKYRYINREEDMGLAGLRFAKRSYRPVELLSKSTARMLTSDERSMMRLWRDVFGDEPSDIEAFMVGCRPLARTFVSRCGDDVVAMLHVVELVGAECRVAYIYAVATAEDYRGRGLASELLTEALAWIDQSKKFDCAMLIASNDAARRLYRRFGFEQRDLHLTFDTEYDFGTGDTTADMAMVRGGQDLVLSELCLTIP